MYKVEIRPQHDVQDLAIIRRRQLEEERRKRIFDPKLRVYGIDVKALEEQIEAKNRRKQLEEQREKSFDNATRNNNTILQVLDERALRAHRERLKEMNNYRLTNQRPEQRREYDLNMPAKLRDQLLQQQGLVNNGGPPPVSGLQGFGGEDGEAARRAKLQKEQMKVWTLERLMEKKAEREKEEAEKKAETEYMQALAQKQLALEQDNAKFKFDRALDDVHVNQVMASWKQKKDEERRKEEEQAGYMETHKWKGDFLSRFDAESAILGSFKGLTDAQRRQIYEEQARQREENENRRRAELEEQTQWARQEAAAGKLASVLEKEKEHARKEVLRKVKEDNERLAREFRERETQVRRQQLRQAPTEGFFAQFSTSSR